MLSFTQLYINHPYFLVSWHLFLIIFIISHSRLKDQLLIVKLAPHALDIFLASTSLSWMLENNSLETFTKTSFFSLIRSPLSIPSLLSRCPQHCVVPISFGTPLCSSVLPSRDSHVISWFRLSVLGTEVVFFYCISTVKSCSVTTFAVYSHDKTKLLWLSELMLGIDI